MMLFLLVALLISAANFGIMLYNARLLQALRPPSPKNYSWEDDDFPAQLPISLPNVALSVIEDPHFGLRSDDDWETLFPPPNNGFVQLGPGKRWFVPAMYHQLHCLDAIRVSFVVNGSHAAAHTEHCLRYLRQAVLCHADTTLETATILPWNDGKSYPAANGLGMIHRCKDWTMLYRWIEDNSPNNYSIDQ